MSPIEPSSPHEGSNRAEDPATIRRTFIWLALAATIMLLPPRQWVSSAIMGVVTLGLFVWHMWKQGQAAEATKRADAAEKGAAPKRVEPPQVEDAVATVEDGGTEEENEVRPASLAGSGEKDGSDRAG